MTLEEFTTELNSLAFFEEFTFSKNKFSPNPSQELELADNIVWLGDWLAILQTKERNANNKVSEDSERAWFKEKVIKRATRQVRGSLSYLAEHPQIRITNARGDSFDIASVKFKELLKLVVYLPSSRLPADCLKVKHHLSKTAGVIHILSAKDYLEICRTLRVPADIFDYFRYREHLIRNFAERLDDIPEPMLMGQFLSGDLETLPTRASITYLERLIQDADAFDLSGLLRNLHNQIDTSGDPHDYYQILIEFTRLSRSAWREVKSRFVRCIENAQQGKLTLPYRIAYPATGCGFVFVTIPPEIVADPDSTNIQIRGLKNFTYAHKYDQKLEKCVGVSIAKDNEYFMIYWCLIDFPWQHDDEMERRLKEDSPFREVHEKELFRFRFF